MHLACKRHKRRVLIIVGDGQWYPIHRENASSCNGRLFNVTDAQLLEKLERWSKEEPGLGLKN